MIRVIRASITHGAGMEGRVLHVSTNLNLTSEREVLLLSILDRRGKGGWIQLNGRPKALRSRVGTSTQAQDGTLRSAQESGGSETQHQP